jgi:23S rRNA (uracil747-C5)-methyltransferase
MNSFCSYFNQGICHSCTKIELPYSEQLESKSKKLTALLNPKESKTIVQLPSTSSQITGFRNKAKFSVTGSLENPIIGLTGTEELDEGRMITNCPVHHPEINYLLKEISQFITLARLTPYQIKAKTGELKGLILYYSSETEEVYLRFILRSKESLDRIKKHSSYFLSQHPKVKSLSANIQPIAHAILEGEEEIFFTDQDYIAHQLGEVKMTLHPQGFVQTNQQVALELYSTAANWVREIGATTFLELFSGQGAFSFFIQKEVKQALGVEINAAAVHRANQTSALNQWSHLKFIAEDAGKIKSELIHFGPEVVLVNPPRRGISQAKELLKEIHSPYIIYSSCEATTLAQDIEELKDHYELVRYQLFDMFPHTDHFETLALLKRIRA